MYKYVVRNSLLLKQPTSRTDTNNENMSLFTLTSHYFTLPYRSRGYSITIINVSSLKQPLSAHRYPKSKEILRILTTDTRNHIKVNIIPLKLIKTNTQPPPMQASEELNKPTVTRQYFSAV